METIWMKCQILFSRKSKKNITTFSSAELALRVIRANARNTMFKEMPWSRSVAVLPFCTRETMFWPPNCLPRRQSPSEKGSILKGKTWLLSGEPILSFKSRPQQNNFSQLPRKVNSFLYLRDTHNTHGHKITNILTLFCFVANFYYLFNLCYTFV